MGQKCAVRVGHAWASRLWAQTANRPLRPLPMLLCVTRQPTPRLFRKKIVDAFLSVPWLLRQTICYFIPKRFNVSLAPTHFPAPADFPITSASEWASKMQVPLLGIEVFTMCVDNCDKQRADIGVLSDVFDFPLSPKPYPTGYVHDLCLIRGSELPDIVSLPLLPRLTSFLPYTKAFEMRNQAIFTVNYPFISGDKSEVRGQLLTGTTMDITTRECLLAAAQIMFNDEGDEADQFQKLGHAILWRSKANRITRTKDSPRESIVVSKAISQDGDYLSAAGYSGSVLCVGSDAASSTTPIPATAQVLGFQNFETALPPTHAAPEDSTLPSSLLTYKGGFRLPDYIYSSRIDMP
ncbi:hypothetical protein C8R44DRAFT_220434 [Mycena epipterygia]|nr:hypothetical protein C8R44DRAFT_220434 [Mycena epipterygia]